MANRKRVLAVASMGGHWVQLRRLRPAWSHCDVAYVTTNIGYRDEVLDDPALDTERPPRFYTVIDANRWQKFRLLRQLINIIWIILRERPNVVVSTGAAPGYFALLIGKTLRMRTIWIDSIANAAELSLSGRKANFWADIYLTQWEHLRGSIDPEKTRPEFKGSVV